MAFGETDTRQMDADRQYDIWTRQGVPHDTIVAMLPALVAQSEEARESAERWLSENGTVGIDLSDQGLQDARHLASRAKEYVRGMAEEGLFSYDPMLDVSGRYSPSDEALNERLDAATSTSGIAEQGLDNAARIKVADDAARQATRRLSTTEGSEKESAYGLTGVNRPFFED